MDSSRKVSGHLRSKIPCYIFAQFFNQLAWKVIGNIKKTKHAWKENEYFLKNISNTFFKKTVEWLWCQEKNWEAMNSSPTLGMKSGWLILDQTLSLSPTHLIGLSIFNYCNFNFYIHNCFYSSILVHCKPPRVALGSNMWHVINK